MRPPLQGFAAKYTIRSPSKHTGTSTRRGTEFQELDANWATGDWGGSQVCFEMDSEPLSTSIVVIVVNKLLLRCEQGRLWLYGAASRNKLNKEHLCIYVSFPKRKTTNISYTLCRMYSRSYENHDGISILHGYTDNAGKPVWSSDTACLSVCHSCPDLVPVSISVCFHAIRHCSLQSVCLVILYIYSVRQSPPVCI